MKGFSQFFIPLLFLLNSYAAFATQGETTSQEILNNQHGKLVWADLYTGDVEASLKFYQQTFGWTVKAFAKEQA